jgi:phage gpG-like protein
MNIAQVLQQLEQRIRIAAEAGLVEAAELVKQEAKNWIGHQHSDWPPLSESTIEEEQRMGYPVDQPLLRTGALRDSIEAHVVGLHAEVGTNHPLGVIHEYGTVTIPPRPFLQPALTAKTNEIGMILRRHIAAALKG